MSPPSELTQREVLDKHTAEAALLGVSAIFTGGTLPGDMTVTIQPPVPAVGTPPAFTTICYHYRRNADTGLYKLIT